MSVMIVDEKIKIDPSAISFKIEKSIFPQKAINAFISVIYDNKKKNF